MFDLIIEWMLNGAIVVAFVCMAVLAICATVVLIRITKEVLKKCASLRMLCDRHGGCAKPKKIAKVARYGILRISFANLILRAIQTIAQ